MLLKREILLNLLIIVAETNSSLVFHGKSLENFFRKVDEDLLLELMLSKTDTFYYSF